METVHTPKYPVQTLEKSLEILELLSRCTEHDKNGMAIGRISQKLGIGKSTVHRILDTLIKHKYVEKMRERGMYRLGWGAYALGCAAKAQHSVMSLDFYELDELCEKHKESVSIGVISKNMVVVVYKQVPDASLVVNRYIGEQEPVYATALGKVLISEYKGQKLRNLMDSIEFRPYTSHTISSSQEFSSHLEIVKKQQFALDEEEFAVGLTCVACPIRDGTGEIVAALSVSGPTVRLNYNKIVSVREDLQRICSRFSQQLGEIGEEGNAQD